MRWAWILLVPLAGCLDQPEAEFSMGGSFTGDRSQDDIDEVTQLGRDRGGDVVVMESFPEQFRVTGMSEASCEELYTALLEKEYLADVHACRSESRGPY